MVFEIHPQDSSNHQGQPCHIVAMDSTSKASLKQKLLAKGEVFWGVTSPSDSICDWMLLKEVRENLGFKSSIYQSYFGNININPIDDSLYFSQKKKALG